MQDLLVLSHEDYTHLRRELKTAGLDLCYTAQSARPIRQRGSPERLGDVALLAQVAQRRPADPSYRVASVRCTRPGNWLWPAQLSIAFHAVNATQDAALQDYLVTHPRWKKADNSREPVAAALSHSTPKTYVKIALILALMTVFEVTVLYVPESLRPPRWALLMFFMLLSTLKFGMVVAFFMHLRYDHRLYAGLFAGGIVVAVGTILALLALFREPSATWRPPTAAHLVTTHAALDTAAPVPVDTTTPGIPVFLQYGCDACHTVTNIPAARGTIGPGLDGLAQRAASRIPGMPADDYVRQSVEAPEAYVVKGYLKLMPRMREQMQPQELAALLSWLLTL